MCGVALKQKDCPSGSPFALRRLLYIGLSAVRSALFAYEDRDAVLNDVSGLLSGLFALEVSC